MRATGENTKPALLVLAAGMGNRYGGLKQIDAIGPSGETLIEYTLYDALHAGFGRIVFVIRKEIEAAFRDAVGRRIEARAPVDYVFQELDALPAGAAAPPKDRAKPWGTGHAILLAESAIKQPFGVVNGDDFYGRASFQALAAHLMAPDGYAMVGFRLRTTLSPHGSVSRGVCDVSPEGMLKSVTERLNVSPVGQGAAYVEPDGRSVALTGDEFVSMNMWGYTPTIFGHLRERFTRFLADRGRDPKAEFFIPTVVNALIASGQERVRVLPTPEACIGVTYREDRAAIANSIAQLVRQGLYPQALRS